MTDNVSDKRFLCLDALRGAAAAIVFIRHAPDWFGGEPMQGSMLAVDLFFIMSGFIVAHAYDGRLRAGMGAAEFIRLRIIRFYPLYFLGLCAGAGLVAAGLVLGIGTVNSGYVWSWSGLGAEIAFGLAMSPTPQAISGHVWLFPLNGVAWSLFFEVLINIAYALTWRHWTIRNLALLLPVSGAALAFAIIHHGGADIGFDWRTVIGGVPRVIFGFAAGVLIFRLWHRGWFRFSLPWWLPTGAAILLMSLRAEGDWRLALDIVIVLALLPVVTILAVGARTPDSLARIFAGMGAASFALYALHRPVIAGIGRLAGLAGVSPETGAPWAGLILLLVMSAICLGLARWFDAPARAWLTRNLQPASPPAGASRATLEAGR
jgi:peptidoglycan/LPS O-acetylase OafA/YrhL